MTESILRFFLEKTFVDDLGEGISDVITGTGLSDGAFAEIVSGVLVPVALTILVLFWFKELVDRLTQINNGNAEFLWQDFVMLGIKLVFAKAIIDFSPTLIRALIEAGNGLINQLGGLSSEVSQGGVDEIMEEIADASFGERISLLAMMIPISFIGFISNMAVKLAIYSRVIKLILLETFSPIPMATLPFEQAGTVGRRFLQTLLATILQGAMIVVLLLLTQQVSRIGIIQVTDDVSILASIFKAIFFNVILVFTLFKSEAWSQEVLGL